MNWHHMALCVVCIVNFFLLMMCFNSSFLFDITVNLSSDIYENDVFTVIQRSVVLHYGLFSPNSAFHIITEMVFNISEFCKINYLKN